MSNSNKIKELQRHNSKLKESAKGASFWKTQSLQLSGEVYASRQELQETAAELARLRQLCSRQQDEISTLNEMADAVERLRDIGKVVGCGHVDDPDGRTRLVHCVETTIAALQECRDFVESFTALAMGDPLPPNVVRANEIIDKLEQVKS